MTKSKEPTDGDNVIDSKQHKKAALKHHKRRCRKLEKLIIRYAPKENQDE